MRKDYIPRILQSGNAIHFLGIPDSGPSHAPMSDTYVADLDPGVLRDDDGGASERPPGGGDMSVRLG